MRWPSRSSIWWRPLPKSESVKVRRYATVGLVHVIESISVHEAHCFDASTEFDDVGGRPEPFQ